MIPTLNVRSAGAANTDTQTGGILKTGDGWPSIFVLIVCIAVFVLLAQKLGPYAPDDAFIGYRYAENLATGDGLTFNPGEQPVEGYSNFLWILLCALLYKTGVDLPSFVPRLGVLLGIANIAVLWFIYRRRRFRPLQILLPLLLLSCSGPFTLYSLSGMETPLFSLLFLTIMLGVDYLFSSGKLFFYASVSFACFLLALCRPEGIVLFPIIVLYQLYLIARESKTDKSYLFSARRNLLVASALFIVLCVTYNAWRVDYFDELLPTPLLSKGGGGSTVVHAWQINKTTYFSKQGFHRAPFGYYYLALFLVAAAGLSLSRSGKHAKQMEFLALMTAVVYVFVYLNFVDWMPGMRYHASLIGLLLIPGAHIQSPFFGDVDSSEKTRSVLRFMAVGMAVIVISLSGMATLRIYAREMERLKKTTLMPLASWLAEVLPSNALVATSDVGIVPYYSRLRTLDIHPESLTDLYIAKNGFSGDYFFSRNPHVVMLHSRGIFEAKFRPGYSELVEDPRFVNTYRFLGVTRFRWFDDRSYWIYVRKDLRVSDDHMERFPVGVGDIQRVGR